MDDAVDPRRAAFSAVTVRPSLPASPDSSGPGPDAPVLRGIGSPAPPKPVVAPPPSDAGDDRPVQLAATPVPPRLGALEAAPRKRERRPAQGQPPPRDTPPPTRIGTRRGNLVYIQTQVTPAVSDQLDRAADSQDLVLGEVLMACVREFTPASLGAQPRRRRRGNQVRRDIGVLPAEADEVLEASSRAGLTVSAFLRQALEKQLPG
jgi:hypothetical protein